jgi:para-nitrobenzyl esterase
MLRAGLLLAVATITPLSGAQNTPSQQQNPVIRTAEGPVRGVLRDGVRVFMGIPFALPPVGDLRWKPPQPVRPWHAPLDASRFGSSCPQVTTYGVFGGPTSVDEDCLYLNVFTTGNTRETSKPVIVWLHGGGNVTGSSSDYDGTSLAKGGPSGVETVVVTLNYRLGVFGTFFHSAINAESKAWGNFNLLDQQAALQWVRRNIAAFGGDPDRVTLAGQSAGAYNVGANLLSPGAKGLFNRAILQSSPGLISFLPSAEVAQAVGARFANDAGCPGTDEASARCLRSLSVARLLQLQGTMKVSGPGNLQAPFVDGKVVPMQPDQAWTSGAFNRVPVMGGGVRDEVAFFTGVNLYFSGPPMTPLTAAQYPALTAPGAFCIFCNATRTMPPGVAERYPLEQFGGDVMVAYQRIGSDGARCRELHVLDRMAAHTSVYAYDFTYAEAPYYFPKMPGYKPAAVHTVDIQFLFKNFHGGNLGVNVDQSTGKPRELNEAEQRLAGQLADAWTRFAATGNPNGSGDTPWPRFAAGPSGQYLVQDLQMSTKPVSQFRTEYRCDFHDPR